MKNIPRHRNNGYTQCTFFDLPTSKHRLCQACGISFLPKQSTFGIYCSHRCMGIGQRKRVKGSCLYCEKEITFKPASPRIYCSYICRNIHLNKTLPRKTRSDWTPEELIYLKEHYILDGGAAVAEVLGRLRSQVIDKANRLKITNGKIGQLARLHRDRPSGYELRIRAILDDLEVTYEASFLIKRKFIVDIKIGNLIIEADGDYWHGHPRFEPLTERQIKQQQRDAARNAYLLKCGYDLERIWESDFSLEYLKILLQRYHIPFNGNEEYIDSFEGMSSLQSEEVNQ